MRAILSNPLVYRLQQSLVWSGKRDFNALLIRAVEDLTTRLGRTIRVLDIGCGDGKLAARLGPHCHYTGVDLSPDYIAHARKTYAGLGTFHIADLGNASDYALFEQAQPDLILMIGVMHHCPDTAIRRILDRLAEKFSDAAFISVDGVYVPRQHWFAHLLLRFDRGEHIRNVEGYRALLPSHDYMLGNFLRVPFDMIVFYRRVPFEQLAAALYGLEPLPVPRSRS